jgi:hypothetical protein
MSQYSLSVQARQRSATAENDSTIMGPTRTVKFESMRRTKVKTGVVIQSCAPGGKIVVTPVDAYADQLQFYENEFDNEYLAELVVEVTNVSGKYIRIDPSQYLFKISYVESAPKETKKPTKKRAKKATKATASEAEVVDAVPDEAAPTEAAPDETKGEADEAAPEVADEAKDEVADEAKDEAKDEVSAEVKEAVDEIVDAVAKPKRRAAQKKKRVSP